MQQHFAIALYCSPPNDYRLIVGIDYENQTVYYKYFLTHAEYDKGKWKNDPYFYLHTTPIHLDLIGNKIWIQYDDTEEGIATDLLEAGVPKENIVLGFRHPKIRDYTGFAVA